MPQFDVSSFSSQLFWLVIVFAFLYLLVSRFITPKAESILTARNRCLEENIRYADEYNSKVESINNFRLERVVEINAQVEDMQEQAMEALQIHFDKQKEELSIILTKKREHATDDINGYVDKFHEDKTSSCVSLASFIVQKITNKPANLELIKKIYGKVK
jgi:F-type H+-transporting ATPase subunit b